MLAAIRAPTAFDFLKVATLGAIWGSAFLAIKVSVHETGPSWLVFIRVIIALLPIAIYAWWRGDHMPPDARDWWLIFFMSLLNTVGPFFLISWAELHIPAGVTSLIMGVGPLGTMIAAHFTTPDDKFSGGKLIGMVFGFLGLAIIAVPDLQDGVHYNLLAYGAVLGGLACYVVSGTMIRFISRTPVPMMTALNMAIAALAMIPAIAIEPLPQLSGKGWLAAIYLGLVCTGLAYLLRTHIVLTIGQSYMSMASYVMPLCGVFLSALLLGEAITWPILAALALIVAGFTVSQARSLTSSAAGSATTGGPPPRGQPLE
ncbi:MAG: DMT family transporter [Alphaproteobacteria bacterium]|nr:DMT family transporter [Alphaproteobacteria bacterium]